MVISVNNAFHLFLFFASAHYVAYMIELFLVRILHHTSMI